MEGGAAVLLAVAVFFLVYIALGGFAQDYSHRDDAFRKADRICAKRGGATHYDVQDKTLIVYQCNDGKGRIATISY